MLRRIRIGFSLLAVVLLAALGFLILRTLDTLDRERELEHASVAHRVFDEAEEALAGFLRDEQARPASDYRERPEGSPWMNDEPPFVLAYFEIDHRGRTRSSTEDAAAKPELLGAEKAELLGAAGAGLTTLEERAPRLAQKKDTQARRQAAPSPGRARKLQAIDPFTGRAKAGTPDAEDADVEEASPYSSSGALQTLGRIAKRVARDEAAGPSERILAESERPAAAPPDLEAATGRRPRSPAADDAPSAPPIPLSLAPSRLSGERRGDAHLVLYRTALDGEGRAVRQGMLVSVDALGDWLTRRVLGESELRDALTLRLLSSGREPHDALPSDRYVYDYRFAEPFESLSLQLAIAPLDDGGNARNIGWLSALLVAASTLGLYAVYRTVAVVVAFAERRSNFAAAVSHELRTPLTAIRMYGEMLRDGMVEDEAKRREYYSTITQESERLTRLVNNVLEWSKLENRRHEAHVVSGDVTGSIRDVVEILRPHARAQGFELDVRLPRPLPPARHDPDALQQILYNLIDNAIKYAGGHAPARIEIAAESIDDALAIRVRDHGPGIPTDGLPLVFDAFYRAENELTRRTKGTGIGLALARGLAESMQARLVARNHPDGGLEVELRLRRA